MKIKTLIENTSIYNEYKFEHGLSLYVEDKDKKILIDVGQTDAFIYNANLMGIDLTKVDYVILSHNHYDHVGGLAHFFKINKKAKVYCSKEFIGTLCLRVGPVNKILSIDDDLLEKYSDRFVFVDEDTQITNRINIIPIKIYNKEYICQDKALYISKDSNIMQDDFKHEFVIIIKDDKSLCAVSPCSHNGLYNILMTINEKYNQRINTFVGGIHMKGKTGLNSLNCSIDYVYDTIKISSPLVDKFYLGHCTGHKAYKIFKDELGDKVEYMNTGKEIKI